MAADEYSFIVNWCNRMTEAIRSNDQESIASLMAMIPPSEDNMTLVTAMSLLPGPLTLPCICQIYPLLSCVPSMTPQRMAYYLRMLNISFPLVVHLTDINVTRSIIQQGANVLDFDEYSGRTALHVAVDKADVNLVKLLLKHGADVTAINFLGETPLHVLTSSDDCQEIAELLIARGANINATNRFDCSILQGALMRDSVDFVLMLLDLGADMHKRSVNGRTALHFAMLNREYPEMVEFVVQSNIELNAVEFVDGRTALHYGVEYLNSKTTQALLAYNVNCNIKDKTGHTPLHLAVVNNCCQEVTARLFIDAGANVCSRNSAGTSILGSTRQLCKRYIVQEIAKLHFLGSPVYEDDLEIINNHVQCKQYFKACQAELEKLKNWKFYKEVTMLQLLTTRREKVVRLARNLGLVKAFELVDVPNGCPIYWFFIRDRFVAAIPRQMSIHLTGKILAKIFNKFLPYEILAEHVTRYLDEDDMYKILYS